MGRTVRGRPATASATDHPVPWWEEVSANARAHGAMPYTVEGFVEISDAVRRGHAVLVKRERVEVADGVYVFDAGSGTAMTGPFIDVRSGVDVHPVAAILKFDVGAARFVLQDPAGPLGAVYLTPRRLQQYLDGGQRSMGVALGV